MPALLGPNSIVPTIPYKRTGMGYPPYKVACPACGAPPRHLCITSKNKQYMGGTHTSRANEARRAGYYS